jgi:quercetin dioxygenase-like cupin family protein
MIKKTIPSQAPAVPFSIDGRIMHRSNTLEAILLTLQPGDSIPMHQNPFDVLFAGIEGTATLTTPRRQETIEPGETIFVTQEEERGWKNQSQGICRVLVIKILTPDK